MRGVLLKTARWFAVTAGIVVLTSFTVDATLNNGSLSQSALGILALRATNAACPEGTVHFTDGPREWCMDIYEVSAGEECPHKTTGNMLQTTENVNSPKCTGRSEKGQSPWVYVTYHQAQEICAKRGMRLPTHAEWYIAAIGTPDSDDEPVCNINSNSMAETGASASCVSPKGTYDMIGNAWEWIDGSVSDGTYAGREIPETGYVRDADSYGVALSTTENDSGAFHSDYFWSSGDGEFGMMRGGYYGSKSDGGLYSIQAQITRVFSGVAVGFRCVHDV